MESNLWVAKEDTILKHFMQLKFWNELINLPNVVCIYVGGSKFYGNAFTTNDSDYDIVVLVDKRTCIVPTKFIKLDGKIVHWTIECVSTHCGKILLEDHNRFRALCAGMVKFNHFSRNNLLYENPIYSSVVDKLIKHKNQLQLLYFYWYVNDFDNSICRKQTYNNINELYDYPKAFYHIFAAHNDLGGCWDKDWILKLKTESIQNSESILNIRYAFEELLNWCNDHPIDTKALETELYELFFDENNQLIL